MPFAPNTAERYRDAFRSRRAYARALLELTAEQDALVATQDYAALVALLTHKQQLIDSLLHDSPAILQAWRDDRDQLPNSARHDCDAILDEAEQLLNKLLILEADSTARLQQHRDVTERLLRDVNHGSQALAAYESPSDSGVCRRLDLDL